MSNQYLRLSAIIRHVEPIAGATFAMQWGFLSAITVPSGGVSIIFDSV